MTFSSPKVIFLSKQDFFFYYEGKYSLPQDYHCFTWSWFILKDYIHFLNDRMDKGFYIAVPRQEISDNWDIIRTLKPAHVTNTRAFLVISR